MSRKHISKIRKSGNSYVLSIPPSIIKAMDLKERDAVQLLNNKNLIEIIKKEPAVVDDEFLNLVDSIYEEYKETFNTLLDK